MDRPKPTERLRVVIDQGIFEDEESLKDTAYRSLLTLRPELKAEIALSLYKREEISSEEVEAGVHRLLNR